MNEEEYRLLLEEEARSQKQYKPSIFTQGDLRQDLNSQYDKGVTSYSLPKLEDYRGERQTVADRLGNGLVNFGVGVGANTLNGIVQTGALLLGAIPAAISDDWSMQDNLNNPISKFITQIQDSVREEMPIYKREEYEAKGLGKIFDSEFWGGTIMDGAAFAASAYLSGMGFSKAFSAGAKALKLGERGILGMAGETLGSAVGKGVGTGDALINPVNLNFTQKVASTIFSSVSESAVEALDSYKSLKQQLTNELISKKVQSGGLGILSEDEEKDIENKATTASNINFALNMGLTGMSDYIQFGKFFGGMTDEAIKARKVADRVRLGEKGYELRKAESKLGKMYEKLRPYATPALDAGSEVVEEGGQFMIQKTLENYYAGDDQLRGDIGKSLVSAFKGLGSPEGIESMLAGAVIGGGTAGVKHFFMGGLKESKQEETALQQWIQDANDKYSWKGIQEGVLKEDNKRRLDLASRSAMSSMAMEEAVKNADGFTYDTLKDINFTDAVVHHLRGGKFQDFIEQLDSFGKASPSELMDVYGDTLSAEKANKADVSNLQGGIQTSDYSKLASELKQQATAIKDSYDKITRRYGTAFSEDETALIASVAGLVDVTSSRESKVKDGLKKLGFDYDAEIIGKVKSDEQVGALYDSWKGQSDSLTRLDGELNSVRSEIRSKLNKDSASDTSSLQTKLDGIEANHKNVANDLMKLDQELRDSVDNVTFAAIKGDKGKLDIKADYMKQFKKARQSFMSKLDERAKKDIGQTTLSQDAKDLFSELEKIQETKNQYIALSNKFAGEKAKDELAKFYEKIRTIKDKTFLDRLTTVHNQNGEEIKLDTGWYYVEHRVKDKDTGELKAQGNQRTYFEITGFEVDTDKFGNKIVNAVVNDTRLDSDTLNETSTEKKIPLSQLDGRIMKLADKADNAQDISEEDKFYMKYRGRVIDYKYSFTKDGKRETKTITGVVSYNKAGYLSVAYFDENENSQRTMYHKMELPNGGFIPQESFQTVRQRPNNFSERDFRYAEQESQYTKIYTQEQTKQWLELQSVNRAIIGIENDIKSTLESQAKYTPTPLVRELIDGLQEAYDNTYNFYEDSGATARKMLVQSRTFKALVEKYLTRKKSFEETIKDLEAKLKIAKGQRGYLNQGKSINLSDNYSMLQAQLDRRIEATQRILDDYKSQDAKAQKHIEMLTKLNNSKIKPLLANIINNDVVRKDAELTNNVIAAIQSLDMIGIDEDYLNNELTQDQTYAIAEYLLENPSQLTLLNTDGTESLIPNKFFSTLDTLIDNGDADQMMQVNQEFEDYKQLLGELAETLRGDEVLEANKALREYEREEKGIRVQRQAKYEAEKEAKQKTNYRDRLSSLDYLMPEEIVLNDPKQRKLELLNFENAIMQKVKATLFPNSDVDLQNIEGYNPHVNELIAPLVYSSAEDEKADSARVAPSITENPIKSITSSGVPLTLAQANGNDRHHWAFAKTLDDANLKNAGVFMQWRTSAPVIDGVEAYDYKEDYGTGHKNIIGMLVYPNGNPVRVNNAGKIDTAGSLLAITHLEEPTEKTTNGHNRFRESDEIADLEAQLKADPLGENAVSIQAQINGLKSTIEQGLKEISDYRDIVLANIAKDNVSNHAIDNQSFGIPVLGNVSKSPKLVFGDNLAKDIHDGVYEVIIAQGESHPMLPGKKLKSGRTYLVNKANGRAIYLNTRKLDDRDVNNILEDIIAMSVIDSTTMLRTEDSVKNHMNNIRQKIHFTLAPKYPERTTIKNGKKDEANSTQDNMVIYDETRGESEEVLKDKVYVVGFVPNSGSSKIEYGIYAGKDENGKPLYDTKIITVEDIKTRNEEGRLFEDFLRNRWHNISSLFTHKAKDGKLIASEKQIDWMLDNVITTRLAPSSQIQFRSTYIVPSKQSVTLAQQQTTATPSTSTTAEDTSKIVSENGVFRADVMDKPVLSMVGNGQTVSMTLGQVIQMRGGEQVAKSYDGFMQALIGVEAEFGEMMDSVSILLNVKDFVKPELLNTAPVEQPQASVPDSLLGSAEDGGEGGSSIVETGDTLSGMLASQASSPLIGDSMVLDDFMRYSEELDKEPKLTTTEIDQLKRMPVMDRLKKYGVEFRMVKGLIDNKAFGKFQRALNKVGKVIGAELQISEDAPVGTIYHEEFHVVEKVVMSPSYRNALYNEWRTANNKPTMSDSEVSEALAEEFRYYAINRDTAEVKTDKSFIGRAMKFLLNKVMKMLEFLTLRKSPKIAKLFDDIYKGYIANNPRLASLSKSDNRGFTVNQRQDITKSMVYSYYNMLLGENLDVFTYLNDLTKYDQFGGKTYKEVADEKMLAKLANIQGNTIEEKVFSVLLGKANKELILAGNGTIASLLNEPINNAEVRESFFNYLQKMNPTYTLKEERMSKETDLDEEQIDIDDDDLLFGFDPSKGEEETVSRDAAVEQIPSNEIDPKKQVSRTVKQLLISVVARQGNKNDIKYNNLGLRQHTDLSTTINSLYRDLSDIDSIDEMYEILERKASSEADGSVLYKDIAKRIKLEATKGEGKSYYASPLRKWAVENAFLQQFSKTQLDLISVKYDKDGFKTFNENERAAILKYKDKIRATIIRKNLGKPELSALLTNNNLKAFLENLGIEYPIKLTLKSRERDLKRVQSMLDSIASNAKKELINERGDAFTVLNKWTRFNTFLSELNKYDNQVPSFSAYNAENKKVYAIQQQSYLTKTVKTLRDMGMKAEEAVNRAISTDERRRMLEEVNKSIFNPYNLRNIKVSTLLGYKGSNTAQKANKLSEGDMLFMFSNLAFQDYVPFIFPADKSTYNIISGMVSYKANSTVEDIADLYMQQLEEELREAYMYVNDNSPKQKSKNLFPVTKSVMSWGSKESDVKELFNGYVNRLKSADEQQRNEIRAEIRALISSPLSGFIRDEINTLKQSFVDNNIALTKEGDLDLTLLPDVKMVKLYKEQGVTSNQVALDLLKFQTANMMLQGKYIVGNLSNYKSAVDFAKRSAGALATKTTLRSDKTFIEEFDTVTQKIYTKLGVGVAPIRFNNLFVDGKATFSALVVDDIKLDSRNNNAVSKLKEGFKKAFEAYSDVDVTDAQGFEHIDSIRFRGIAEGTWTENMEQIYRKDLVGEASIDELMSITMEKTQYYGKQYLPNQAQGNNPFDQSNNATFYKLSVIPVTRTLAINKDFRKTIGRMDAMMRRTQIPLIMMESSNKVGRITDNGTLTLKQAIDPANADKVQSLKQISFWEDYGTQVKIDKVDKTKQTKATQHRKLIMLNTLRNGGQLTIDDKKVNSLSLFDKLNDLESEKLTHLLDEVIKDLDLQTDTNGMLIASDMSKLAKSVVAQLEDRESPKNVIDSIASTLGAGRGIDLLNNKLKIESIATAFVNKVIKQKVTGTSLPQAANIFDRVLEAGDVVYNEDGTRTPLLDEKGNPISREELKFYDDGYLEVYLPNHFKKYFNVKGEIDAKLLTMVGFRIPVQGHNSMERIKVKGFLPSNLGNMIVVPYEITKKAGSDFDIDKLNLYYYGVTKEGKVIPDYTNEEAFRKWYDSVSDNDKSYHKYKSKALDNAMLTTYLDVLGSEEIQQMMLIPIADDELKSAVKAVRENRGSKQVTFANYFNPANNVAMKTSFEGGKQVLGAVALHNTHHALSQFAKLEMALNLKFQNYKKSNGRVSLFDTDTTNGELISDNISQLMSAAVDVAKDDYIKDINLTLATSSVYLLLVRSGIPLKDVVYFMSQPIITEYVNRVNTLSSNYYGTSVEEVNPFDISRIVESKIKANFIEAGMAGGNIENLPTLTTEYLYEGLKQGNVLNEKQYNVFMEFLKVKEKADSLSKFMNASSYDTKGISNTLIQADRQIGKYDRAVKEIDKKEMFYTNGKKGIDGFFLYTGADGKIRETFLGKMKNIVQQSSKLLSPLYNGSFTTTIRLMDKYKIMASGDEVINKYSSIINGVINSAIVNMRLYNQSSVGDRTDYLFKGNNSLANRIGRMAEKGKFKFLDSLSLDPFTGVITLNGSNSMDVYETDDLVDAFYELESEYPDITSDLVDAVLLQSGVHNSPVTYLNVIPFEKIMERVGQFYQNDYFEESFEHLVLLNDYKKILPYGSGVDIENMDWKQPRIAYYKKGRVEGTYDIIINGIKYEDNNGTITSNGETVIETIGVSKRDYKKRGFIGTEKALDYNPVRYAKFLGIKTDTIVGKTELDRYLQENAQAINEGKITVEEVVEWAKKCGTL